MAGLMAVTAFLSMWINNAATASIMVPVVLAITEELEHHGRDYHDRKQAVKEANAAVNGKRMKK
jgi:sodium-dependent dicarboxylate transporter 2/3/5